MPGTIQVSILELVGLPSASEFSSMCIKVKVGKQAHEAQDRGDFSFPLASLRDNVNVSIHDSEGNEIAHTAVDTRSIVEKGIWDDLFALRGGGHVHMRLLFILTEDELKRIRSMRESATRKKQEDLLTRSRSLDLRFTSGGSPTSSQDSSKTTNRAEQQYKNLTVNQVMKMAAVSHTDILSTRATPALTTSKSNGALDKLQNNLKEVIHPRGQEKQNPLDKTPSGVRKRILAFETKPVKEALAPISEASAVPQISSVIVYAPAMIGANAKPVPILEGTGKAREENRDCGRPMSEEQLVQKSEQLEDLKPQNVDYMSSKNYVPKLQPTTEEKTEERALEPENVDCMPCEKDVPEMQSTGEEKKDRTVDVLSNKKDIHELQLTREEQENLKLQNIDVMPSRDVPEMQRVMSDDVSIEKEIPRIQPTGEEKKEEKNNLELQNNDYVSSKKDVSKMQPTVELLKLQNADNMSRKKDIPKVQPAREDQKEKKVSNLQNIDYMSSEKDIAKMKPTREEPKEEKTDLKLQNILFASSKKDIPEVQPAREEQEEEKKDLKLQITDYSSKEDVHKMQPTREEQKEDLKLQIIVYASSKKDIHKMKPTKEEQHEKKNELKVQNIGEMSTKKNNSNIQPTREEESEKKRSPKNPRLSSTAASSRYSWGGLARAFPSRTPPSPHSETYGNENYISDRFTDWIFLEEMICSCIPSDDDRPFVDLQKGCTAHVRSERSQGKLADNCASPDSCVPPKKSNSGSSPNGEDSGRPIGKAMKIAIMVGFGFLVLLTRQRR